MDELLFGLAHLPADVLQPKYQPREIPGLEIIEVGGTTAPGFHPLTLNVDASGARTLKWDGGRTIALAPAHRRFVLPDARDGHIEVEVTEPDQLPADSREERVLIERARLDERTLGRLIDRATDWLEATALQVLLEPTRITTDPAAVPDHDLTTSPLTLHVTPAGKWTGVRFPFARVTRVLRLVGQLAGGPVLEVPPSWIQLQEALGYAQLVPGLQAATWQVLGSMASLLPHGAVEIPGFWHFTLVAGLREVPGDVVEAIAKKAALDALTLIGQAHKPGIASESLSKEMSVSTSYVRTAQANLLSASRAEHKADLDALIPRLRSRYLGLASMTIL